MMRRGGGEDEGSILVEVGGGGVGSGAVIDYGREGGREGREGGREGGRGGREGGRELALQMHAIRIYRSIYIPFLVIPYSANYISTLYYRHPNPQPYCTSDSAIRVSTFDVPCVGSFMDVIMGDIPLFPHVYLKHTQHCLDCC